MVAFPILCGVCDSKIFPLFPGRCCAQFCLCLSLSISLSLAHTHSDDAAVFVSAFTAFPEQGIPLEPTPTGLIREGFGWVSGFRPLPYNATTNTTAASETYYVTVSVNSMQQQGFPRLFQKIVYRGGTDVDVTTFPVMTAIIHVTDGRCGSVVVRFAVCTCVVSLLTACTSLLTAVSTPCRGTTAVSFATKATPSANKTRLTRGPTPCLTTTTLSRVGKPLPTAYLRTAPTRVTCGCTWCGRAVTQTATTFDLLVSWRGSDVAACVTTRVWC